MNEIRLLDKDTIDKIAAGEVIERPSSVVKELLENSIDSGASSISVEIKNGGIDLIRVTDNGCGIEKSQLKNALLRHSTSKIESVSDLSSIHTLGFRGEALSSICAVSRLEILTKTKSSLMGSILKSEGTEILSVEDAGLPDGTTIIARNLFYNVPARLKFLKSAKTEGGYISEITEKIALSNPDIAIKFTNNSSIRLLTSGNGLLRDTIYCVYGREISSNLLEINQSTDLLKISGFVGKPEISRSTRAFENIFINGRYVKDKVVSKAVEDSFAGYQMKGSFPFCCINIEIDPSFVDVNVHPSKLEVKFTDSEGVYNCIYEIISEIIKTRENIPSFSISENRRAEKSSDDFAKIPANCEKKEEPSRNGQYSGEKQTNNFSEVFSKKNSEKIKMPEPFESNRIQNQDVFKDFEIGYETEVKQEYEQESFFDEKFISQKAAPEIKIIGQIFDTYWICEYNDKMYIIDQHAAHEKVLYEKFMRRIKNNEILSQMIAPSVIISLSPLEELTLEKYEEYFKKAGFEISHFGGSEYALSAAPSGLYTSISDKMLFLDTLDELSLLGGSGSGEILLDRVASAACKAAVKGNNSLSFKEAEELIKSLLELENPYNCPHGRPTIISMSKYEIDKKFKRII